MSDSGFGQAQVIEGDSKCARFKGCIFNLFDHISHLLDPIFGKLISIHRPTMI